MIITRLQGGLGNQLFQYAIGRAMAVRTRQPLRLDTSLMAPDSARPYQLHLFNIDADMATPEDFRTIWPDWRQPLLRLCRAAQRHIPVWGGERLLKERGFPFNTAPMRRRYPVILEGCWQSERYFTAISSLLRQELSLRNNMSAAGTALIAEARRDDTVSLHIRRGDYLNPGNCDIHNCLDPAYYDHAMTLMAARIKSPRFLVFSDDLPWARAHIRSEHPVTFIEHADGKLAHEELMIMSRCRHHIIANSTFSWWGAWLNPDPEKIVVAPRQWFLTDIDTRDMIPARWMRI